MSLFRKINFYSRLVSLYLLFLIRFGTFLLRHKLRRHKTSGVIYSIIGIELLILFGQIVSTTLPRKPELDLSYYQTIRQEKLNLNGINTYQLIGNKDFFEAELNQYQAWLELEPTHRDLLINTALLHASLGQFKEAQELLKKANQVDPNWPFWL